MALSRPYSGHAAGYVAELVIPMLYFHAGQVFRQVSGSESQIVAKVQAVPIKI